MSTRLQWEVFVSGQIPVVTNDLAPGATEMKWSPISSTLISGERDAALVDTAITVEQNQKIADWGREHWQESDDHLRDPWSWRPFLWCEHNPEAVPQSTFRCETGGY
jgi:hypothetical protein